jgi:6-phosphogluconolactonase
METRSMMNKLCIAVAISVFLVPAFSARGEELRAYIGTYTGKASKGIYLVKFDTETGKLGEPELAGEAASPSFIAIHPTKKFLYAVNEVDTFDGQKAGAVSAFAIDAATGKLTLLNQEASAGRGPAYLSVDKAGKNVLVANYGSGSVGVLPILPDGKLAAASSTMQHEGKGTDPKRQEGPHAHSINLDPANRFAFAADLGLDKIFVYKFDGAAGQLAPNDPPAAIVPPGSGPRHTAFHPDGKHAFVINEMGSTLIAFAYDAAKGVLTPTATASTLPPDYKGSSTTAEVVVHPSGKFVYGSNRGHDSIAAFAFDAAAGSLKPIGITPTGGKMPRNFNIDPTGTWLVAANQGSDSLTVFKIDAATGALTAVGTPVKVGAPVCIKFVRP